MFLYTFVICRHTCQSQVTIHLCALANSNVNSISTIGTRNINFAKIKFYISEIAPLVWESDIASENDEISSGNKSQASGEGLATPSLQESEIQFPRVPIESGALTS
jgi:hypothetical protein